MVLTGGWNVSRSGHCCRDCGAEIGPGRSFFSGLKDDGSELERVDFCPDCWGGHERPDLFCHWKSRRPQGAEKPVVNTDLMLEFFDRLDALESDKRTVFRFVLALYLTRRKEFKLLEVKQGADPEILVFERRRSGDRVEVEGCGLSEEEIRETEANLSRLLSAAL